MITVLTSIPCCSAAAVVIKMALDQVLLSPIGICLFYSIIKTMEGTRAVQLFVGDVCLVTALGSSQRICQDG